MELRSDLSATQNLQDDNTKYNFLLWKLANLQQIKVELWKYQILRKRSFLRNWGGILPGKLGRSTRKD